MFTVVTVISFKRRQMQDID